MQSLPTIKIQPRFDSALSPTYNSAQVPVLKNIVAFMKRRDQALEDGPMRLCFLRRLQITAAILTILALQVGLPASAYSATPAVESQAPMSGSSAVEIVPSPLAYYHFLLGYKHYLANDIDQAVIEYGKALSFDPGSITLQMRLAALFHARGDHAKAQAHAEQALAREPGNIQVLQLLGAVAAALGQPEQAEEYYRRVISLRPDEAEAYFSLGMVLAGLKRYEEAERTVKR